MFVGFLFPVSRIKNVKYQTLRTAQKINRNFLETEEKLIGLMHIYMTIIVTFVFVANSLMLDMFTTFEAPGGSMSQVVGLPNNSYKPITNTAWVRARLCILQKRCTRLAATSGRWLSPGTPASSTTKTCRHDIAEILLNVALNTINH